MAERRIQIVVPILMMLSCLVTACPANKMAREVAGETLAVVAVYEKQVDKKVATERAFYRRQAAEIRNLLTGATSLSEDGGGESGENRDVGRSLAWGQIVNGAHRDARIVAETLINSPRPNVMASTISFVRKGVEEESAAFQVLSSRRTRLLEALLKELATIDQQKSKLAKVKKALGQLSKPSGTAGDFDLIRQFAEPIIDTIEKLTADEESTAE